MIRIGWILMLAFAIASSAAFAQKSDEEAAAREKLRRQNVLIDSIVADSRELRLPENRAIVYARVGTRLWELDQKRARQMFEDAVNELMSALAEMETERLRGRNPSSGIEARPQILQIIAGRDADFALQSLYRTRPPAVDRAIVGVKQTDSKIRNSPGSDAYLVQNELGLEQSIVRQAADQNPEKAAALIRAALKKGVTGDALPLLQKLNERDQAAAADLGSEVVGQLVRKNFTIAGQPDYAAIQTSITFLNDHIQQRSTAEKRFRFAASDMKTLADKLVAFFLDRVNQAASGYAPQMVTIAEKIRPDAVEKLKEVASGNQYRGGLRPMPRDAEVTRLLSPETTVEEMIAQAPKLSVDFRRQVYQNAANRLVSGGDVARARQLITENFSDDALTNAQEGLDWSIVTSLINKGRYGEAEAMIDEFSETTRLSGLISLAESIYNRDTAENQPLAARVLGKASALVPARPENNTEMQQAMQVIAAYSRIDPPAAFRFFEGLIPQLNEIAEASSLVSGYQGTYNYRRGELVLTNGGNFGFYLDGSMFRDLAKKDFDRSLALTNAFSRRELRLTLKQQLLDQ